MIPDEEIKIRGLRALVEALGDVQAARFVSLLTRSSFDYTRWQAGLWPEKSVDELSREAMELRSKQPEGPA